MKKLATLFFLCVYALSSYAQEADKIVGIWWNDEKTTKIQVEKVDGKYSGTIVYMIPEKYENGQPPKDDPKSGKTYDCYGWLENDDLLKLKGFVAGMRWLGRSSEWYRTSL